MFPDWEEEEEVVVRENWTKKDILKLYEMWNEDLEGIKKYDKYYRGDCDFDDIYKVNHFNIEIIDFQKLNESTKDVWQCAFEMSDYVDVQECGKKLEQLKQNYLHELFLKWIKEE